MWVLRRGGGQHNGGHAWQAPLFGRCAVAFVRVALRSLASPQLPLTGLPLSPTPSPRQDGRNYSAGDFIRRLKVQHVDDMDAQAAGQEDPEAFNWCGWEGGAGAIGRWLAGRLITRRLIIKGCCPYFQ